MLHTWQDFDRDNPSTWGWWFGYRSTPEGHILHIYGPYQTEAEVLAAIGA